MPKENETLNEDFSWDGNSDSIDFFGENTKVENETTEVVENVIKDDLDDKKPKDKEEENKEEDKEEDEKINFFEDEDSAVKVDNLDSEEEEEQEEETVTSKLGTAAHSLEYLKSKGLIGDYELEEGAELTEDLATEILEDKFEESVDGKVEELMKELPDVVKQINKFALAGGDLNQFFSSMIKGNTSGAGFDATSDISDEKIQEIVIRQDLKTEGFDDEHINSQIEFYKDSGKLASVSKLKFDKFVEADKEAKAGLVQKQLANKEADKEKQKAYKAGLATKLNSIEDVNGVKFNKEEVKNLPSYMSDRTIKMKNGSSVTPMQKDLYEALQDPEKSLVIAKILNNGFDFKEFSTEAKTRVVSQIKNNLQNNQAPAKSGVASKKKTTKRLADYFD